MRDCDLTSRRMHLDVLAGSALAFVASAHPKGEIALLLQEPCVRQQGQAVRRCRIGINTL